MKEKGSTVIHLNVATPPAVSVKHLENRKAYKGSRGTVSVVQSGKEIFSFRSIDTVFMDEGEYEFRSKVNDENDLSLTQSIKEGDNLVTFTLQKTVRAQIRFVSSQTKEPFSALLELSQERQVKYKMRNPIRMLPGTYDVKMRHKLAPHEQKDVVITDEQNQKIIIELPTGLATFIYKKPDGSRDTDARVFVNGQYVEGGAAKALLPGKYYVDGWRFKNKDYTYDRVEFEIQAGDEKDIFLQAL